MPARAQPDPQQLAADFIVGDLRDQELDPRQFQVPQPRVATDDLGVRMVAALRQPCSVPSRRPHNQGRAIAQYIPSNKGRWGRTGHRRAAIERRTSLPPCPSHRSCDRAQPGCGSAASAAARPAQRRTAESACRVHRRSVGGNVGIGPCSSQKGASGVGVFWVAVAGGACDT